MVFGFKGLDFMVFESAHVRRLLIAYANSEVSEEPAHLYSLHRAFADCSHDVGY